VRWRGEIGDWRLEIGNLSCGCGGFTEEGALDKLRIFSGEAEGVKCGAGES
jgi:hypothetical protein